MLPRDHLSAAEKKVKDTELELKKARELAKRTVRRADLIADRPDLARIDRLIQDNRIRQSQLVMALDEYRQTYKKRLEERARDCPFGAPSELNEIERLRWLQQVLKDSKSDADLMLHLNDPRMEHHDKEEVSARIESNRTRNERVENLWGRHQSSASSARDSVIRWEKYVRSVSDDLRDWEDELGTLKKRHDERFRSEVEAELGALKSHIDQESAALAEAPTLLSHQLEIDQHIASRTESLLHERTSERRTAHINACQELEGVRRRCLLEFQKQLELDFSSARIEDFIPSPEHPIRQQLEEARDLFWWERVAAHSVASIVERLQEVPDGHVDVVLGRILNWPANDPHILSDEVHGFLRRYHHRLIRSGGVATPVVVAYVARLVAESDYAGARGVLSQFPAADRSALSGVFAYLRYVVTDLPDLTGKTYYRTLSDKDLFLGACYYEQDESATTTLLQQSHWDYRSLRALQYATSGSGANDLNNFKVRGLQPRIAELAFRSIYEQLHGAAAAGKLHDLNLKCVGSPPPKIHPRPTLPAADWQDGNGQKFDVKSNLFYRSRVERVGLRGFLIKRSKIEGHSFPGVVFTNTSDDWCEWVYVGNYRQIKTMTQSGDRVLPFCFRLPDNARYIKSVDTPDSGLVTRLLNDYFLRIGWQLAIGARVGSQQGDGTNTERLMDRFVDCCLRESASTFLEYALWKALTEVTLEACSQNSRDGVDAFLRLVLELVMSSALPVRFPRINGAPILGRWITEVLQPLHEHWSEIRCLSCDTSATQPGAITLEISQMTSEGTILGRMTCNQCGGTFDNVTFLTHCHGRNCNHYPLIIGKNRACASCKGLVCEWRLEEGQMACNCHKPGCPLEMAERRHVTP
jgi:hypothetical protein